MVEIRRRRIESLKSRRHFSKIGGMNYIRTTLFSTLTQVRIHLLFNIPERVNLDFWMGMQIFISLPFSLYESGMSRIINMVSGPFSRTPGFLSSLPNSLNTWMNQIKMMEVREKVARSYKDLFDCSVTFSLSRSSLLFSWVCLSLSLSFYSITSVSFITHPFHDIPMAGGFRDRFIFIAG